MLGNASAEHRQVLVIGGGVTGLCAGFYLAKHFGVERVRVLEAGDAPGGTTRTDQAGGFTCEWGPNGFLDKEPLTLQWLQDLGLEEEVTRADEAAARRFIMRRGRLHELKGPPAFFKSQLLSKRGRARLVLEPLVPAKRDHRGETIWNFAARRIGAEAADVMVSSMVSGVFGGDAKKLSLEHCFPRMAQMEREYGGLLRALIAIKRIDKKASPMGPKGVLTSLRGGIGGVAEAAAAFLGERLQLNALVVRIARQDGGYAVTLASGERLDAAAVIIAAPAYAAASMVEEMAPEAARALNEIPYAGLAVMGAGFPRDAVVHDLHGFGFLIPRIEQMRALGCLWTSAIFPGRAPEGHVLMRVMFGGSTDPEAVSLSDEELRGCFDREIRPLLGIKGAPVFERIFRHPRGIPQYQIGHAERLEAIDAAESAHPGLVFAGNAYRGVSLNDCVLSAHRAVARVEAALREAPAPA